MEQIDTGSKCPCCGQFVKLYKRKLNAAMARSLIGIYRYFKRENAEPWLNICHFLTYDEGAREEAKLAWWGLIEPMPGAVRADGSPHVGMYRITQRGIDFVEGRISVERYAFLYNQQVRGFSDERTTIEAALTDKFNYSELMAGM